MTKKKQDELVATPIPGTESWDRPQEITGLWWLATRYLELTLPQLDRTERAWFTSVWDEAATGSWTRRDEVIARFATLTAPSRKKTGPTISEDFMLAAIASLAGCDRAILEDWATLLDQLHSDKRDSVRLAMRTWERAGGRDELAKHLCRVLKRRGIPVDSSAVFVGDDWDVDMETIWVVHKTGVRWSIDGHTIELPMTEYYQEWLLALARGLDPREDQQFDHSAMRKHFKSTCIKAANKKDIHRDHVVSQFDHHFGTIRNSLFIQRRIAAIAADPNTSAPSPIAGGLSAEV